MAKDGGWRMKGEGYAHPSSHESAHCRKHSQQVPTAHCLPHSHAGDALRRPHHLIPSRSATARTHSLTTSTCEAFVQGSVEMGARRSALLLTAIIAINTCTASSAQPTHTHACRYAASVQRTTRLHGDDRRSPLTTAKQPCSPWTQRRASRDSRGQRQPVRCKGYENFKMDVGAMTVGMSGLSWSMGVFSLGLHVLNQLHAFGSLYVVGATERVVWLINQLSPVPVPDAFQLPLGIVGLLDYVSSRWVAFPIGHLIFVLGLSAQALGGASLFLSLLLTFDAVLKPILLVATGVEVERELAGWGCGGAALSHTLFQQRLT